MVKIMKNTSIWLRDKQERTFKPLTKNLKLDCLIIGGGITGVSLLYELSDTNLKVALVERNKIAEGVTSKSTAKINYLQGITYSKIQSDVSRFAAEKYLESQKEGIEVIKSIVKKEKINCNLEQVTSRLYGKETETKQIEKEYMFLKENNIDVEKQENNLSVKDTYVFNPVKYVDALANICLKKEKKIYENSLVTEIISKESGYSCKVNGFTIEAKKVVLACHYPFELFPFFLPTRTYIEKSYIMANKTPIKKEETFITTYPNILSKRYYETYEIVLKGSHNICNKLNAEKNFAELSPNENTEYLWSNEDIMTSDHLPFIGFIDKNLLLSTGYNTWGMATSAIASKILKDTLLGKYNKYLEVFHPYRSINLAKIKQYPINLLSNVKGFVENKIYKKKKWYPKNLTFSMKNWRSVAKYKIGEKEHIVYTTCPHMFCTLTFNEIEKTWDCPCHASRFDITGKCIKGPSIYNITYKEESSSLK